MVDGILHRYRSIRTPRARAILQIQHRLSQAIRKFLDSEGFTEILAPIIGPVTDPGIRGAEAVPVTFYGQSYVLMTSMILYKQMAVTSFPRVYSFSPNIRLESEKSYCTGRHLAEFYQVDLEVAYGTCADLMTFGDQLLFEVIKSVRRECAPQLELLGRTLPIPPYHLPRITHAEVIEILRSEGFKLCLTKEIPWKAEHYLSKMFTSPFWITDYPTDSRGFYYLRDQKRPSFLRSMDLLLPEGYGEVVSGGEREYTLKGVTERMQNTGENPAEYSWYLEMLQEGIHPSAGFGIGVERLTRFICGVDHIWECTPFPKVPGIL
jgi:asparaginyl-tRNA synthetase